MTFVALHPPGSSPLGFSKPAYYYSPTSERSISRVNNPSGFYGSMREIRKGETESTPVFADLIVGDTDSSQTPQKINHWARGAGSISLVSGDFCRSLIAEFCRVEQWDWASVIRLE